VETELVNEIIPRARTSLPVVQSQPSRISIADDVRLALNNERRLHRMRPLTMNSIWSASSTSSEESDRGGGSGLHRRPYGLSRAKLRTGLPTDSSFYPEQTDRDLSRDFFYSSGERDRGRARTGSFDESEEEETRGSLHRVRNWRQPERTAGSRAGRGVVAVQGYEHSPCDFGGVFVPEPSGQEFDSKIQFLFCSLCYFNFNCEYTSLLK